MDKGAIKNFAVNARKKLRNTVENKMGMLGITKVECTLPVQKGEGFEEYKTTAGTENRIYGDEIKNRLKLVNEIQDKGYDNVIEEVAYTWFNRIIAIRFMEVNGYLPTRVRVLSSDTEGKIEPDILNEAPDIDLDLTDKDIDYIYNAKSDNKLDELFRFLFIKQCNKLGEILPELFEKTKDYTEMLLNISYINEDDVIRMLVDGVPEKDFDITTLDENGEVQGQVEIIGWLFQYYNTELKDDTFAKLKKKVKISKERIPAATQLFTPDWIVKYMVENSLGRLWIEHLRAIDETVDEKEMAEKFGWKYYLPEAKQEDDVNIKLTQIRKSYKDLTPQDITCIDPCNGSGHILVYMFDVLMDIYTSEGYSEKEAVFYIINKNIKGLDIDKRAYQLAYFSIMMKGRSYNRRFFSGKRIEQEGKNITIYANPNLYSIEESNKLSDNLLEELSSNFKDILTKEDLKCIKYVQEVFYDAKEYGSILNIDGYNDKTNRNYEKVRLKLHSIWKLNHNYVQNNNLNLLQIDLINRVYPILYKLLQQAQIMSEKYDIVVTNPPYKGVGDLNSKLSNYLAANYPHSKKDLFATFIEVCGQFVKKDGYQAMITQQSWLFKEYEQLRINFLNRQFINCIHLGAHAFDDIKGEVVKTVAFIVRNRNINNFKTEYIDLTEFKNENEKKLKFFIYNKKYYTENEKFKYIPNNIYAYWLSDKGMSIFENYTSIKEILNPKQGTSTGNDDYFVRSWSEVNYLNILFNGLNYDVFIESSKRYVPLDKGGEYRKWYGNNEKVIKFNREDYNKLMNMGNHLPSRQYYFKKGITWSKIASNISMRFDGEGFVFSSVGLKGFPNNNIFEVLGYLNSCVCKYYSKVFSQDISIISGDIEKLPYKILNQSTHVTNYVKSCISLCKKDWDSFEISWDFTNHPLITYKTSNEYEDVSIKHCQYKIKDAFNSWKENANKNFYQLKKNEEELNRIFIDIYGLKDELTPEEDDKDVTVHYIVDNKEDASESMQKSNYLLTKQDTIKSFISYAVGCILGRYSIDTEGLIYAGEDFNDKWNLEDKKVRSIKKDKDGNAISDTWVDATFLPEKDNIIPINEEDYFQNDIVTRFVEFVKTVYGNDTLEENLNFIAESLSNKGSSSRKVIRNYFLKDFYKDHVKMYQKRPIYWLFDSGKENGFKALIYMHRYDRDTVGKVRTEYLHNTQKALENSITRSDHIIENSDNAREKSKATKEKNKYIKQLAETRIYDEAMANIANKRIDIDLDDGVKVNYAKFQGTEIEREGQKSVIVNLLAKI